MGYRTLIELDHDRLQEIENNPEEFVQEVVSALKIINWQEHPIDITGGEIICARRTGEAYEMNEHGMLLFGMPDEAD